MAVSLDEAYIQGKTELDSLSSPELEARVLLCSILSLSEEEFFAHPKKEIKPGEWRIFLRLLRKRRRGCPLAYLTGEKEFWSLPFLVKPGVLVPRPETELLVERTIVLSGIETERIVDIGTGCGNIAVCLALEIPQAAVLATDVSRRSLRIARANSRRHALNRIELLPGDMFAPLERRSLEKKIDFLVSNPPYLSEDDWVSLSPEFKRYEPKRALVSGKNGLEKIAELVGGAGAYLKPGGYLLFEIGDGQKDKVLALFDQGWTTVETFEDLSGIPRVVAARAAE